MNFNHFINKCFNCLFVIGNTWIYKLNIVKLVISLTLLFFPFTFFWLLLRLRLNRVKTNFRNQFPENPCVWLSRKTLFSRKWFSVDHKFHLWPGNEFLPSFSLQFTSGKREREKERERESTRAREEKIQSEIASSSSSSTVRSRSRRRLRSGAITISDRDRSVIAIAMPSIAISDRNRDLVLWSLMIYFPGSWLCVFWFVFSFFFSKHQKIFSGKFFEMQPNTWKHFPFPEINISGKYVFFGKCFTATKHSLN